MPTDRSIRGELVAATSVFAYGTVVHLVHAAQMAMGNDPYRGLPAWIAAFFWALLALDPAVAVLLILRPNVGWIVGCLVLWLDALTNAVVNYPPQDPSPGLTAGRVGQAIVTLLAAAMLFAVPRVVRAAR